MSKHEKSAEGKELVRELVAQWRARVLGLDVDERSYSEFGEQLAKLVKEFRKQADDAAGDIHDPEYSKRLMYSIDAIQDGCAELFADWREGMALDDLSVRIREEQEIWQGQLQFTE